MAIPVTLNGVSYSIPQTSDQLWGDNVTNYLVALASGTLSKAGGLFTLTADVNFGATFGVQSVYYKSLSVSPSGSGQIRLGNLESVSWRNAAGTADLALSVVASNRIQFGAIDLADISSTQTLTNKSISGASNTLSAIPYSALVLTGLVVNADISATAAIVYSKLNLSNSIQNADVSASAAIVYSKLNLTGAVQNADLAGSIAVTKLAAIAAGSVLMGNASTVPTATAITGDVLLSSAGATSYNNAVPVGKGGTGVILSTAAATANANVIRDANANAALNNLLEGYTTTATAAATTTLTVASTYTQYFTGTTTQTVVLPVASTLVVGQQFSLINRSTGIVTVQSSGLNTIQAMASASQAIFTCILASGTTAASWDVAYIAAALTNPMTTGGDLIVGGSSGTPARLANGTSGQYLQAAGGTAVPAWTSFVAPTVTVFKTYATYYTVTATSCNATAGATYTNNTFTFVVSQTVVNSTTIVFTNSAGQSMTASGTLTKASGTGDATITFSAVTGAQTYLLPTSPRTPLYIRVRMVGGGGGGGGGGTASSGSGASGGSTTFGTSLLVANGGGGGLSGQLNGAGGTGGAASIAAPAVGIAIAGGNGAGGGSYSNVSTTSGEIAGVSGGASAFGGAGQGLYTATGTSGQPNSGSGGGSGSANTTSGVNSQNGGGGGAAGFADAIIYSPAASFIFVVATSTAGGGVGGTNGYAGGTGGTGMIEVTEYYQ